MTPNEVNAYIIGIALGDGSVSNPSGRALRLRITCDNRYPALLEEIRSNLQILFPKNKVSFVKRKDTCTDISVYSNELTVLIPWNADKGSKYEQSAHVPEWIFYDENYIKACLRGLIASDGSIYTDRKYLQINFSTNIKILADDVSKMIIFLGYTPHTYITNQPTGKEKYPVRVSKNTPAFLKAIKLEKKR